jgi:uncharacterized protein involved in exopolysaccharide biosynthesis
MSQMQSNVNTSVATPKGQEIEAIDLALVLARNKKLVIGFPLAVAVGTLVVSLILPDIFRASTKLLPPQQSQSGAAALLSQLGGIAGAAAGATGMKSQSDVYVGILKSRTIADRLIDKYDLKKVYDTKYQEAARRILEDNTAITTSKEGLITIEVEDKDRRLATSLANAYTAQLLDLTKVLAVTEAGQRRLFFERQLAATKDKLADAEIALKQGLDTQGVISVDTESRAIVETAAKLRAQVSAKEIELRAMEAFVTSSNPDYRRVQEALSSLRQQLAKIETGGDHDGEHLGAGGDSQAGLQNIKRLRDVKYQQMLYELLAKQYEVARLDEAKEPSVVQILDPAVEPERKAKPKRFLMILLAALISLFGSGEKMARAEVVFVVASALRSMEHGFAADKPSSAEIPAIESPSSA